MTSWKFALVLYAAVVGTGVLVGFLARAAGLEILRWLTGT